MARERVTEVNARRLAASKVASRVGVGITVGDVSYGNIGAPNRLDFTVIGAAVILASRLEGLCRPIQK